MTINNSTISGNSATGNGGGLKNLYASVTLIYTTKSANPPARVCGMSDAAY